MFEQVEAFPAGLRVPPGRTGEALPDAALFAEAGARLGRHEQIFLNRVAEAERLERRGRWLEAVVAARAAADFASTNHTGRYASPELEALLGRAGQRLAQRPRERTTVTIPRERKTHVLHVFSAAYDIGGHTRLVWRWIGRDPERTHSVALTHQRQRVPEPLEQAVNRSRGRLYRLDDRPSGLFERARRLAELSREVDLVVLHTHPFDVIPALAFAADPGAPVALFNHADHVFWLSRNVARLVVDFRHSGSRHSVERRGVPAAHTALLPIPLEPPRRTLTRGEAKVRLGLSEHDKVIFSVALPYKYTALGELDFARDFADFAREHGATVLVVGPGRDARWAHAEAASGGRVRALGRQADLSLFHQAADLYVDSYPFGSATSLLEAGSYGVPVLTHNPFAGAGVMTLDDPALPPAELVYPTLAGYHERLAELLGDDLERGRVGAQTAERITDLHAGDGWSAHLESVYTRAAAAPLPPPLGHAPRAADPADLLLSALGDLSGRARTPEQVFTEHLQLLPLRSRVQKVLAGHERPGRLLSDWLGQRLEDALGRGRQAVSG